MPDHPSDPPEYDWLYGKKRPSGTPGGAAQAASGRDDDHTRVMPTMSRTGRAARGTPPPPPRDIAPTPGVPRPRRRRRFGIGRSLLLLFVAWLAFMIAVPVFAFQKMVTVDAVPGGERPEEQPGTTYLVVGSDSRRGLTEAEKKKLGAGGVGEDGGRTDTIMVLHTGDGPSLLMSIPRDSNVDIPGRGTSKINAAFAFGGPQLLVQTIEQNTGLRVDHYVEIGFGGFVNAVDAVGGIEICPKQAMDDPRANLKVAKGCQEVDGITALGYSRSRYAAKQGDIGRAENQREVVSAIGSKVKSPWTVLNPFRYYNLNMAMPQSVRVSEGTGPIDMGRFAFAMTRVNGTDGLTCGIPIADLAVNWDRERALALLKLIKEDRTADVPDRLCTPDGMPR